MYSYIHIYTYIYINIHTFALIEFSRHKKSLHTLQCRSNKKRRFILSVDMSVFEPQIWKVTRLHMKCHKTSYETSKNFNVGTSRASCTNYTNEVCNDVYSFGVHTALLHVRSLFTIPEQTGSQPHINRNRLMIQSCKQLHLRVRLLFCKYLFLFN